ncbi:MAG TPA: DUF998 domain-containing protein [Gemmatimonadaceae bacterium]|nr:DUF998 domain-containing protein [Gemmatimonadaceae bacterium]
MRPVWSTTASRRALLLCGILSSLLYVAMNVFVSAQWPAYSSTSQTVSELSAVGAPTRSLWVGLGAVYTLLVTAFGLGVWISASRSRSLRIAGGLILVYGALGLIWPFAPMHLRETLAAGGGTVSDTVHIALGMVTLCLMLLAIGFGGASLGGWFRLYSIATIALLVIFGALTGLEAPEISKNGLTPWIGVWERASIGLFLLWVGVVAMVLLRGPTLARTR